MAKVVTGCDCTQLQPSWISDCYKVCLIIKIKLYKTLAIDGVYNHIAEKTKVIYLKSNHNMFKGITLV